MFYLAQSITQFQETFTILEIIGIATSGLSLLYLLLERIISKKTVYPLLYIIALHTGMLMVFVSLPYFAHNATVDVCATVRFLVPAGYGIGFGAIFAKLFHLSRSVKNMRERARGVPWTYVVGITVIIFVVNIVLSIIWYYSSPYVDQVNTSKYSYINVKF
jgi:hypothetical protein